MLITTLGAGDTQVGKMGTVLALMELAAQQGDSLKAAKQINQINPDGRRYHDENETRDLIDSEWGWRLL